MQQQMMAGQYDPNQQFIGPDGMPLTQEQYQQLLAQGGGYMEEGEYGQEMMHDPNQFINQPAPEDEIQEKIQRIIEICTNENAFFGD